MQWYGALLGTNTVIQVIVKNNNTVIRLVVFFFKVSYIWALQDSFRHRVVSYKYQKIAAYEVPCLQFGWKLFDKMPGKIKIREIKSQ